MYFGKNIIRICPYFSLFKGLVGERKNLRCIFTALPLNLGAKDHFLSIFYVFYN